MKKKITKIILAVCLVVAGLPLFAIGARANDDANTNSEMMISVDNYFDYRNAKLSFRGFLSASGAMLILYQPKKRRFFHGIFALQKCPSCAMLFLRRFSRNCAFCAKSEDGKKPAYVERTEGN